MTKALQTLLSDASHLIHFLQGLLRQLVLLSGSDATVNLCVNSDPSLAELSIPHVLKSKSVYPSNHGHIYSYGKDTF